MGEKELNTNCCCNEKKLNTKEELENEIRYLQRYLRHRDNEIDRLCVKLRQAEEETKVLTKTVSKLQCELESSIDCAYWNNKEIAEKNEALNKIYYACKNVIDNFENKPRNAKLKDFAKMILNYVEEA